MENQSPSRPTADANRADQSGVDTGSQINGVSDSLGRAEHDQGEEESNQGHGDLPDPGSQKLDDRPLIPLALGSQRYEEEPRSGLDLEELCGLAETVDIKLVLDFIVQLQNASLEDDGMQLDPDLLERLCNPIQEELDIDDLDL